MIVIATTLIRIETIHWISAKLFSDMNEEE